MLLLILFLEEYSGLTEKTNVNIIEIPLELW